MSRTKQNTESAPPFRRGTCHIVSEIAPAPTGIDPDAIHSTALGRRGYRADSRWRGNFERMAQRAARSREFYAIAGCNIQRRADEIRAGWSM
jgi:hypothetical protein